MRQKSCCVNRPLKLQKCCNFGATTHAATIVTNDEYLITKEKLDVRENTHELHRSEHESESRAREGLKAFISNRRRQAVVTVAIKHKTCAEELNSPSTHTICPRLPAN